jgi:hypothetical protein
MAVLFRSDEECERFRLEYEMFAYPSGERSNSRVRIETPTDTSEQWVDAEWNSTEGLVAFRGSISSIDVGKLHESFDAHGALIVLVGAEDSQALVSPTEFMVVRMELFIEDVRLDGRGVKLPFKDLISVMSRIAESST